MCFGGGSDKSSREMVAMQKEEAAQARQKETERQARITQGLSTIKGLFEGSPVMKDVAKTYNFGATPTTGVTAGSAVSGLPAGYKYVAIPSTTTATTPTTAQSSYAGGRGATQLGGGGGGGLLPQYSASSGSGGGYQYGGAAPTTAASGGVTWGIQGPDGKIYHQGEDIGYTGQEDTGQRTGGFDDAFYNKYAQAITDYYLPQVAEQYGKAQDQTLYGLARANLTKSEAANQAFSDLEKQNVKQQEKVRSQADTAKAELKTRVAGEEQKAIGQLYSTENPDVAANTATASAKNISAEEFDKTPLADLFNVATYGGAGALQGYQTQKYRNQIAGLNPSGSTTITS